MRNRLFVLVVFIIFVSFNSKSGNYPFQNEKLSFERRAEDLVSRLTLEEKVSQMMENAPAIPKLGIPAYNWWNETLHGVARSKDTVTVFPQAIALAANFDSEAVKLMGKICAEEARAIYNQALKEQKNGERYKGLTFWTPNINIFRDPRWGRGQETYGEDPYLTGQLGMAIVNGLQGDDNKYLKTSACAKHFAIHSGPESTRHTFDANVSDHDLWNTYLPAFRDLVVDAKVSSVMCAYNRYQGAPCCGNEKLMVSILRKQWGFSGYVTSDCGAVTDFWMTHKTALDEKHASADAVKMGTDLECGEFWNKHWTYKTLSDAVKAGLIDEKKLDESVKRLFLTRMKLGMFDSNVPFDQISYTKLNDPAHKEHALKMARQSMVLLKNNGVLPLRKNLKSIAVIGPNADNKEVLLGNYNGIPQELVTVIGGIKKKLVPELKVIFDQGVDYTKLIEGKNITEVANKAAEADVIIFAGGINSTHEGEEGDAGKEEMEGFYRGDRTTIALPRVQTELMKALKSTGKPVVFVNMSGSAIGMEWEAENVDAILQAWYGGQSAGTAIADVLFGDYNPSGRLPVTFYRNDLDLPDFSDYNMTNRTYRYFKGKPLYEFGYGLSYTTFAYRNLRIPEKAKSDQTITLSVEVQNTGKTTGEEVVQLYVSGIGNQNGEPLRSLKGFQRVKINPGEKKDIFFDVKVRDLGGFNFQGEKIIKSGQYLISIGGGQPSAFNLKTQVVVQSEICIE